MTPAHHTGTLAELVCSNSLKSEDPETAAGLLKHELDGLGSVVFGGRAAAPRARGRRARRRPRRVLARAHRARRRAPAHRAGPRTRPSSFPTARRSSRPGRSRAPAFEPALAELVGRSASRSSTPPRRSSTPRRIDRSVVFAASRYDKGGGADYLNAPMDREQYDALLRGARRRASSVTAKDFERKRALRGVPAGRGGRPHRARRAALRRAQAGRA